MTRNFMDVNPEYEYIITAIGPDGGLHFYCL